MSESKEGVPRGVHEFRVLWQEAVLGERDAILVRQLRVLRVRTLLDLKAMLQRSQVVEVVNEVTKVKQGGSLPSLGHVLVTCLVHA